MILSKPELQLLDALKTVDGLLLRLVRPRFRKLVPRLRELGLLYRRDPKLVRLTEMGKRSISPGVRP
jgi:hypothetical protein